MLDRPGRCPADRAGDARRSPAGDQETVGAGALGDAGHRAQVVRVDHLVQRHQERPIASQKRLRVGVRVGRHLGHHSLMLVAAGAAGEFLGGLHPGLAGKPLQRLRARGVHQTASTWRRPRSASRTGCRPQITSR